MAIAVTSHQQRSVGVIDAPDNVRELDADHVGALAASIQLHGLLVPLVVRGAGADRTSWSQGFTASRPPKSQAPA